MKIKDLYRGIVVGIESFHDKLTFITLEPIDESYVDMKIPLYMKLNPLYLGKPVDVVTERSGVFGGRFKQTIQASSLSNSVEMPYSLVKEINQNIRRSFN